MVTKRELVRAVLAGRTVKSGGREYRFDEELGFVYRLRGDWWRAAAWHLGVAHEYVILPEPRKEKLPSTLFEAINYPGTGASMRAALGILAAEWKKRGGDPENSDCVLARYTHSSMDGEPGFEDRRRENHAFLVHHMPKSLLQKQLIALKACPESVEWAGQFSTAREAWNACENPVWMRWLVQVYSTPAEYFDCIASNLRSYADERLAACAAIRERVPFERLRQMSRSRA